MQKQGIKTIALIGDTGGFGKDGMAVFKAEAPKYGITIVSEQTFNLGDTDMTAQLTKIKAANPDAVVRRLGGQGGRRRSPRTRQQLEDRGAAVRHARQRARRSSSRAPARPPRASSSRPARSSSRRPTASGTPEYKVAQDFITRFKAASGGKAPDTFAGHAYDAINIIAAAAAKRTGDLTPGRAARRRSRRPPASWASAARSPSRRPTTTG